MCRTEELASLYQYVLLLGGGRHPWLIIGR